MAIVKTPSREYRLGETLPPIGQKVVSWPWGGTPHLTQWSLDHLKFPLGTIIFDTVDGHPVIAQIQTHDTYGAHPEYGVKPHKGTSVFVPVIVDGITGKEVAMRDAPDGWAVSPMAGEGRHGGHSHHEGPHRGAFRRPLPPPPLGPLTAPQSPQSTPSSDPQPSSQGDTSMPAPSGSWRDRFNKIPKLGVLLGASVAGTFYAGVPGAVVGFGLALVADKEVRGGPWLPDFHGDIEEFRRYHRDGRYRREHQIANGDFGIGTIIPSSGPKNYMAIDSVIGTQTLIQGKSPDDAVNQNLGKLYPGASTVMRLPGTDTFQTDKGDTFRVGLAG